MGKTILGQSGEDTAQSTSALQEAWLPPANYCSKHIQGHQSAFLHQSIYLPRVQKTSASPWHTPAGFLLVDLQVPMREEMGKVLGQDREMHGVTARVKSRWREKKGWSSTPGFPIIIFNIFAATTPTSAPGSHP